MSMSMEERKAEFRQLWLAVALPAEPVGETDKRVAAMGCCQPMSVRIWRSDADSAPSERVLAVLRREVKRGSKKKLLKVFAT
jgi:hypothetical protein